MAYAGRYSQVFLIDRYRSSGSNHIYFLFYRKFTSIVARDSLPRVYFLFYRVFYRKFTSCFTASLPLSYFTVPCIFHRKFTSCFNAYLLRYAPVALAMCEGRKKGEGSADADPGATACQDEWMTFATTCGDLCGFRR